VAKKSRRLRAAGVVLSPSSTPSALRRGVEVRDFGSLRREKTVRREKEYILLPTKKNLEKGCSNLRRFKKKPHVETASTRETRLGLAEEHKPWGEHHQGPRPT